MNNSVKNVLTIIVLTGVPIWISAMRGPLDLSRSSESYNELSLRILNISEVVVGEFPQVASELSGLMLDVLALSEIRKEGNFEEIIANRKMIGDKLELITHYLYDLKRSRLDQAILIQIEAAIRQAKDIRAHL